MRSSNRLRHNDDFRLTTRQGVRAGQSHAVVHLAILDSPELKRTQEAPRVGFVVSKKVGNSVVRSRVKRRLRAIMHTRITALPPYSCVVIRSLPGINDLSHPELVHEIEAALSTALRKHAKRSTE